MIVLSNSTPLARGHRRAVYTLPDDESRLVKVLHSAESEMQIGGIKGILRRMMPSTQYRFLFREYSSYLGAAVRHQGHSGNFPIAHQGGVVETDIGLGMICERISFGNHLTGPSVRKLARRGELAHRLDLLNSFAQQLFSLGVRANDIHAGNIVLGNRNGNEQFVLIDGMGDSNIIPIRTWSARINALSLHSRMHRTAKQASLRWLPKSKCFSLTGN